MSIIYGTKHNDAVAVWGRSSTRPEQIESKSQVQENSSSSSNDQFLFVSPNEPNLNPLHDEVMELNLNPIHVLKFMQRFVGSGFNGSPHLHLNLQDHLFMSRVH